MGSMMQSMSSEIKKGIGATIQGAMAGTEAWGNAKRQKINAMAQSRMSAISAGQVRNNMKLQELDNQNAMDNLARQRAAVTESYRQNQAEGIASTAAGNVDISSGSAAQIQEGNALAYANDAAAGMQADRNLQWQGESTLSLMDAQARGLDKISAAQRSIANMINPFATGLSTGVMKGLSSYFSS